MGISYVTPTALTPKGTWNANTNEPTLGDNGAGGVLGDFYIVDTAGTTSIDGNATWAAGDWIIHNGTTWDRVPAVSAAASHGHTGSDGTSKIAATAGITLAATSKILGRATAGAGACEEIDCTAAGRALLDDANAAAQRTTLGLGTAAVEAATAFDSAGAAAAVLASSLQAASNLSDVASAATAATNLGLGASDDVTHASVTAATVSADTVSEKTAAAGVTIDGVLLKDDSVVFCHDAVCGVKVDQTSPVYGWKDLTGQIVPRSGGAPAPAFTAFRGTNLLCYAFDVGDKIDNIAFHWPHDYVPGSDVFFHVHWGHNGTAIAGTFKINWFFTWAKGYNQAGQIFNAEKQIDQTISITNVAGHPQWGHIIDEFQLSNAGGDATHLDRALFETDGLLMVSMNIETVPTITGSATTNRPYVFMVDVHYQSNQLATKARNAPFYV